jgi:hypothetical protein
MRSSGWGEIMKNGEFEAGDTVRLKNNPQRGVGTVESAPGPYVKVRWADRCPSVQPASALVLAAKQ